MLDNIKTQVWYLSDAGTYGRVNRAHADFLGFHPREIAYRKLEDFLSPDVAAVCRSSNQAVFAKKETIYSEEWVPDALGEKRLIRIIKTPKCNKKGRVEFVICTGEDITEQRQTEAHSRYQLGLITSLVNSMPDLVFYKDLQGVYLGCNLAFAGHVGRTQEEIIGKTDYDLYTTAEANAFRANDMRMLDMGRPRHNEEWINYPDGRRVLLDTLKAPLFSLDGDIIGSIGISRDITKQKQLEAKIRHLQKTESLGRMAGAVAHHYNNMLSIVQGYLELALDDLSGDADTVKNLSTAMQAVRRTGAMGHKMLAFLGKTGQAFRVVDLSRVCSDYLNELEKKNGSTILLEIRLPDSGPFIHADAGQLREILENLVNNALESMADLAPPRPLGVELIVVGSSAIPMVHRFPVDFHPVVPADYACLKITDQGHGIPDDVIENIFDPFYSTRFLGRGLGLALTLGMVKALEGCIAVEKSPGQGMVFQLFLPVKSQSASMEENQVSATGSEGETGQPENT
ncbi:MAG: PAS domain-containing protein [Desulfotignum sp.]